MSPLDVAIALADDRGVHVTSVSMRIRRTDAFSGLDALRQPPAGTALSTPLPQSPPLECVWLDVALQPVPPVAVAATVTPDEGTKPARETVAPAMFDAGPVV